MITPGAWPIASRWRDRRKDGRAPVQPSTVCLPGSRDELPRPVTVLRIRVWSIRTRVRIVRALDRRRGTISGHGIAGDVETAGNRLRARRTGTHALRVRRGRHRCQQWHGNSECKQSTSFATHLNLSHQI